MFISRQLRVRKIKQRLALLLSACILTGMALFVVLKVQAGIAVWTPPTMTQISSSGGTFACGIADGKAYCWGYNVMGQLGNNSTTQSNVPVPVDTSGVLAGKTITAIAAGAMSTCVIASDGNAYCWGDNTYGQLGNNSTTESHVPVAVDTSGVLSGKTIKSISVGIGHSCAIASDGNAYCWGFNTPGQLGNNSTTESHVPVAVTTSGVLSGKTIKSISAGAAHTCVIASDNNAYCWGMATAGQLGNNSTTNSNVPVAVDTSGVLSGKTILSISAGAYHTCAIASDNNAYCWGNNGNGRLGNNSTTQSNVPVAVTTSGVLSGKTVLSLVAGYGSSCAIASDNLPYCWGLNSDGQLGNNSTSDSLVPAAVSTSGVLNGKTVKSIIHGGGLGCVIASDNHTYCWGDNDFGELGNNLTTGDSWVPTQVLFNATFNAQNYRLYANANSATPGTPLADINTSATLSTIGEAFRVRMGVKAAAQTGGLAVGGDTSCVLSDNNAYCWGQNDKGQLGNNSTDESSVPIAVDMTGVLSGKTIVSMAVGGGHVCALASDKLAYCWGDNTDGQLGNNSTTESHVPVAVTTSGALSGKTILSITASEAHTCVVASDNNAYCWGDNTYGQLGNNSTTDSTVPVAVTTSGALSGKTILSISAGDSETCVVASDKQAYCWGNNTNGKLGNNSTTDSIVPVAVYTSGAFSGKTVKSISAGESHACAIASDNNAYCWGWNYHGQLGSDTAGSDWWVPRAVDTSGVLSGKTILQVDAGQRNQYGTCAIASDQQAYCWGFGNGPAPVVLDTFGVLSGKTVTTVDVGAVHGCVMTSDGKPYCEGNNWHGELGNGETSGTASDRLVAVLVDDHVPTAEIPASANTYKLQYALKTVSSCSAQTGFADVTASSAIAFNTNASVSNGASITGTADDPVSTTDSVPQAYISASGAFTNTSTITSGKTGLWDFSLKDNSGLYDTSYCLRITYNSGQNLEGVVQYPEITTATKFGASTSAYRLYQNADSLTPGTALAAANTAATLTTNGQAFRARLGVKTDQQPALSGKTILSSSTASWHTCAVASDNKAYCWGLNEDGQLGDGTTTNSLVAVAVNTAGVLSGKTVTQVTTGVSHSCALTSEGKVYCWGENYDFQLGDDTADNSSIPVAVDTSGVLSGKTVTQVAAGRFTTCALTSEGKVYCWGRNSDGQLGNNSTGSASVPVEVYASGVLSGKTVTKISSSEDTTCALTSDSAVYCWGLGNLGYLGDGDTSSHYSTVPVGIVMTGVLSGKTISEMSAGGAHVCVLASDNKPYCWGYNAYGQLGNNSTVTSGSPVAVTTSGVLSGKTLHGIESGYEGSCVLDASNNAYCWGMGTHGELGNSASSNSSVPVAVTMTGVLSGKTIDKLDSGFGDTNTGAHSVCARTTDGGLYCWGANGQGQLGNNSTTDATSAVAVSTTVYNWRANLPASANAYKLQFAQKTLATCSVQTGFADVTTSSAIAFNTNASATHGAAITTNANDPVATANSVAETYISATGTFTNPTTIPAGKSGIWDFSLKDNSGLSGTTYCLKIVYSDNTTLSDTAYAELTTAIKVDATAAPYRFYQNANSLTPGDPLGVTNQPAQLTSPNQAFRLRAGVQGKTTSFSKITSGAIHTCGISLDNQAYCWGWNEGGQLGNNSRTDSLVPVAVDTSGVLSGKTIKSISAGAYHTCAIASDNNAYCWGYNGQGQLGDNSTTQSSVPVAVDTSGVLSGKTILSLSTGSQYTCAIASDNNAYCWGGNGDGQLGNNSTTDSSVPVAVDTSGLLSGKTINSISAGGGHTCAIASDNHAYCWGYNGAGRLGNNSTTDSLVPVAVDTSGVLSGKTILKVDSGDNNTCAIASDNHSYCWGQGDWGQTGDGAANWDNLVPVAVDTSGVLSGKTITSLSVGSSYSCAIASDNNAYCWGRDDTGQLGDNPSVDRSDIPVTVVNSGVLSGKTILTIDSGENHTCVIASDNQAYCWGAGYHGRLGDSSITDSPVPVKVTAYAAGHRIGVTGKTMYAVSAGTQHTCAIASDNLAYCWGSNWGGQLGNNTQVDSLSPVAVDTSGVLAGKTILSIGGGGSHTCAIASDHQAYCWGWSVAGDALGTNTGGSPVPVAVDTSGVLSGKTILSMSVQSSTTCVIASDHKVYCWGDGWAGQLGNNTTTNSNLPVAVDTSGVLAGKTMTAVSVGDGYACALDSDHHAYCWGGNGDGQLGNNSTTDSSVPVAVDTSGLLSGKTINSISAGGGHTCAIASDNHAYCWGDNSYRELGNGFDTNSSVPVAVDTSGVLSGKTLVSISVGDRYACTVASDSNVYCWGWDNHGQLGDNRATEWTTDTPVAVSMPSFLSGKTILTLDAGVAHACIIASDNQLYCWGDNTHGQLGDGLTIDGGVPTGGYNFLTSRATVAMPTSTNNYTLQYAVKSAGTCAAQTTGFADVTTSTPIAFNTNASATHGSTITTNANDPLATSAETAETYISAPGTFTNGTAIAAGTMGLWDFSLKDNGAPYNTTYCLRVAYSDGTALTDTPTLPEVTTTTGTLSVGFVDAMGQGLTNPTTTFGNITASTTSYSTPTTTLGTSTQKLRIYNDIATNGWSASIAATNGPTALWDRADHLAKYDFNDPSIIPDTASDSDAVGGALVVMPLVSTLASPSGCSTTGLTLGGGSPFSEGMTDSITLLSASSTAAMGCAFDLTNVGLVQYIPAAQPSGTYTLDMTITVVAL